MQHVLQAVLLWTPRLPVIMSGIQQTEVCKYTIRMQRIGEAIKYTNGSPTVQLAVCYS